MKAKGNAGRGSAGKRGGLTGRWLGFAVAFLGILLGTSISLRAQGVRYDNIVLGPRGGPVASATVAVCASGATTSTTPCSPLATVYSDEALTKPMANPFQADSLGNYGFWAAPGHYVVQIYGTGLTTRTMNVFLPCDPSDCSMSNASISSITAGTLNLTGSLTVNGRAVATEPNPDDGVVYVSPNGNDSASGMSWGSAKKTLYAAVYELEVTDGTGGTVFVAPDSACGGPVSGQGLWLVGSGDSTGYASPPSGWIKTHWPLKIIGVGVNGGETQNSPAPEVPVSCGSSGADAPLWISGTTWGAEVQIDNISWSSSANNALKLGISTSGSRTSSGASDVIFHNDSFAVPNPSGTAGPTIDIGANVFWVRFYNTGILANTGATALSDARQGVVINPTSSASNGSGLIFFHNTVINGGGIRFYGNSNNGGSLYVNDLTTENVTDGSPAVWITDDQVDGSYRVSNVGVADATANPTYAVKVDGTEFAPGNTVVSNVGGYGQDTSGPMTLLGGGQSATGQNTSESPLQQGQQGFEWGGIWAPYFNDGFADFGPKDAPWPNIVSWGPNVPSAFGYNWSNQTGGSLTQVTAPDGTQNAWELPSSISTGTGVYFLENNLSVTAGDYFIAAGWSKMMNGAEPSYGSPFALGTSSCGSPTMLPSGSTSTAFFSRRYKAQGWIWSVQVMKIGATDSACQINFSTNASVDEAVFAPILIQVPASAGLTDSGVLNLAANIAQFPSLSQTEPIVSTLAGHPLAFGGSGDNYFAILDHTALTANRTYDFPDVSGTIALAGSGGVSAGTITLASGAASHTFTKPYSTTPVCTASDTTSAAAVKVTSSTTAVTLAGTGTDVIAWVCSPATN